MAISCREYILYIFTYHNSNRNVFATNECIVSVIFPPNRLCGQCIVRVCDRLDAAQRAYKHYITHPSWPMDTINRIMCRISVYVYNIPFTRGQYRFEVRIFASSSFVIVIIIYQYNTRINILLQ